MDKNGAFRNPKHKLASSKNSRVGKYLEEGVNYERFFMDSAFNSGIDLYAHKAKT